jgi:hypothetical protein
MIGATARACADCSMFNGTFRMPFAQVRIFPPACVYRSASFAGCTRDYAWEISLGSIGSAFGFGVFAVLYSTAGIAVFFKPPPVNCLAEVILSPAFASDSSCHWGHVTITPAP